MKKIIGRLGVRRETIRKLAEKEIAGVAAGGNVTTCTAWSEFASGCKPPDLVSPLEK
jgi:hypothetical protein